MSNFSSMKNMQFLLKVGEVFQELVIGIFKDFDHG
jgi:hypothetical protein